MYPISCLIPTQFYIIYEHPHVKATGYYAWDLTANHADPGHTSSSSSSEDNHLHPTIQAHVSHMTRHGRNWQQNEGDWITSLQTNKDIT